MLHLQWYDARERFGPGGYGGACAYIDATTPVDLARPFLCVLVKRDGQIELCYIQNAYAYFDHH